MPPSFFQSVFDSDPPSPQLRYRDSVYIKREPGDFMDFLVPFSDPVKSPAPSNLCPGLDSGAIRTSNSGASVTSISPLHTPDMLDCGSGPDDISFGSDSRTEVDDAFIHQISCFSDLSAVYTAASNSTVASPSSLSHHLTSSPKAAVDSTSSISRTQYSPSYGSGGQSQIFAHNPPVVLSYQPKDIDDWVEYPNSIASSGHMIDIHGWEPSENDRCPLANVDLKDWTPRVPTLSSYEPRFQNGPDKQGVTEPKSSLSSEMCSAEGSSAPKKTWGRRVTSNRQLPEARNLKKRRVDVAEPPRGGADGRDHVPSLELVPRSAHSELDSVRGHNRAAPKTQNVSSDKSTESSRFDIPSYIFPQPAVARAITLRAAEDERRRALAANIRLLEQQVRDDEAGETRRLVDEFFDIPDDTKEEILGSECAVRNSFAGAFNPSHLPSPVPGSTTGVRRGLRPARSFFEYSASTRRRALGRSHSEIHPHALALLAGRDVEGDRRPVTGRTEVCSVDVSQTAFANRSEGLDTFPLAKRLFEGDDVLAAQRGAKRARAF